MSNEQQYSTSAPVAEESMDERTLDQTDRNGNESDVTMENKAKTVNEEAMNAETGHEERVEATQVEAGAQAPKSTQALLFRHPTHRLIGGVCGGLADYLGLDASLVRILWMGLTVGTAGAGILAYLALWLLLPVGTAHSGQQKPAALELNQRNVSRAGILLVGFGLLWLMANLGVLPWLWNSFWTVVSVVFWPVLLIGAGMLLLNNRGEWRANLRQSVQGLKDRLNGRVPNRDEIKEGLKSGAQKTRQRIPIKRSRSDRIFLGVCAGIGKSFNIDPNLVRLIWAAFTIGSVGMGVFVYVLVALMLPEEENSAVTTYGEEAQDVQIIDGTLSN